MWQTVTLLMLATVAWADLSTQTNEDINTSVKKTGSGCHHPFVTVGSRCYYFSNEELSFEDAFNYCGGLSNGQVVEISLAMFDYSIQEDQDLLDAITARNETFWIGGKTEDGNQWKWVDGRDVNIEATFWFNDEPNEVDNTCLITQVYNFNNVHTRTYLYDSNCDDPSHFICQTGCPIHFRRLGDYCYMMSSDIGIPNLPWQDARDYCQALSVYEGYHADLAVLGLPNQDDYYIMKHLLTSHGGNTWVGGVKKGEGCQFEWLDGRELAIGSMFWLYHEPDCSGQDHIVLINDVNLNRRYIGEVDGTTAYPFICQRFKDV
ncbi:unnamed protein product [Meganyctiphanes norvegica]|uniref:C-type lectin domain-containing protein n=1 Tax=Meganyctiphanes norvegica TaxID=48144 RepID=A0AAV2PKL3_MEGNR